MSITKLKILSRMYIIQEKMERFNNDTIIKALEFKLEILKVLYGSY